MLVESQVRDGFTRLRRAACAGGLTLAICLAGGPAAAQIQVTSAGAEYESFHPRPVAQAHASGEGFQATMDRTFGPGRWRQTSGFRTQAQENALRRQGAGTVAPGRISYHSLGAPDAPHAYDAVVAGMSPARAAVKLKQVGGPFTRVLAEGAHGPHGAHLHIELASTAMRRAAPPEASGDYATAPPPGRKRSWRLGQASVGSTSE
jgi:hypothetical protein